MIEDLYIAWGHDTVSWTPDDNELASLYLRSDKGAEGIFLLLLFMGLKHPYPILFLDFQLCSLPPTHLHITHLISQGAYLNSSWYGCQWPTHEADL